MEHFCIADLHNPDHANTVVQLLDAYAMDPMGGGEALSTYARTNLIAQMQQRPHVHAVLAFVDEAPAGLAICIEGFSSFACRSVLNVHDMVVLRVYRGTGLSQRLLARVEALARARDCCKLTLEVLEGNRVAQRAYRAFGFDGYELNPENGKALFWQKKLIP